MSLRAPAARSPVLVGALSVVGFALALALRLVPRWLSGAVDYDEGVYVAGAWALAHGHLPWRDFVFLHPPGILLWLAPFTLVGPKLALFLARAVSAVIGSLNCVLVGRLIGGWGGLTAGLFLATWFENVTTERAVFVEPLMTFAGLVSLTLVHRGTPRSARVAGIAAGLSFVLKVWGGFWGLAAFMLIAREHRRAFLTAALATVAVVIVPFVIAAPGEAFFQSITVHSFRPPDGELDRWARLREMFVARSLDATVVMLVGLPFALVGRLRRLSRRALLGSALLVTVFLIAPAWWTSYSAALAPFLVLVLGTGVHALEVRIGKLGWLAGVFALGLGARHVPLALQAPDPLEPQLEVAAALAPESCAFEISEVLLADRPPVITHPILIDSYGQGLRDATREGVRFGSATELFASEASQTSYRKQLEQCPALRSGPRGEWQLNAHSKELRDARFGKR